MTSIPIIAARRLSRRARVLTILAASILLLLMPALADAQDTVFEAPNHALWQGFLDAYVVPREDGINAVLYASVADQARQRLRRYIDDLSLMDVGSFPVPDQRAYWINLYNAVTVDVILENYPVKSIRNIRSRLLLPGPWKRKLVTVAGRGLSLDNIEHDILRNLWPDPRIHYAVNCASIGCPNLAKEAYSGEHLEAQLERAARTYVNHPRGVSITGGKLKLSSIYKWYRRDFGKTDHDIIAHLMQYAEPPLAVQLAGFKTIAGYQYDWALNETAPAVGGN